MKADKPERYLGPAGRAQAERDAKAKAEKFKPVKLPPKMVVAYVAQSMARSFKRATKGLVPRKRIARRTTTRAAEERSYLKESRADRAGKRCAVFPHLMADQTHHIYGRRGKLLLWRPGWLHVSQRGHDFIRDFPIEAKAKGWLCPDEIMSALADV